MALKILCDTPPELKTDYVSSRLIFRNIAKSRVDGRDIISLEINFNIWDVQDNDVLYRKNKIEKIFYDEEGIEKDRFFEVVTSLHSLKNENKLDYL